MNTTVAAHDIAAIEQAECQDPFAILGMHPVDHEGKKAVAVRAFFSDVQESFVYDPDQDALTPMNKVSDAGFFEAIFPDRQDVFVYHLETVDTQGERKRFYDVYSFLPVLSEDDLYLYGEGKHYKIYEKLGCHLMSLNGIHGALFAVWAPSAKRVSVVGDFNDWDGRKHPMRLRGVSGIWELFIPGMNEGDLYKFEVQSQLGHLYLKMDPFAFYCQQRPETSSIVKNIEGFEWDDRKWLEKRGRSNPLQEPISVYEVHLGSWRRQYDDGGRPLSYKELAGDLIPYVRDLGFTHIELLPVSEYPFDGSWGYQPVGLYAPTIRFGPPHEFRDFIDAAHNAGLGVLLDWVPGDFSTDEHGPARFDGTALYEHADPREGFHQDWNTYIYNYGRTEVANFLISKFR
jgi:1,4-alpha-glucan branching enzyme